MVGAFARMVGPLVICRPVRDRCHCRAHGCPERFHAERCSLLDMPRPQIDPDEKHDRCLSFHVTDSVGDDLDAKVAKAGLSRSVILRAALVDYLERAA